MKMQQFQGICIAQQEYLCNTKEEINFGMQKPILTWKFQPDWMEWSVAKWNEKIESE